METCTCVCDVWNLQKYNLIIYLFMHICFIVISVQGSEDCVTRFSVNKKQCVTARTNQMMHVDNIIYHKKTQTCKYWLVSLKGTVPRDFLLQFFHVSVSPKPRNWVSPWVCFFFSKIPRDFLRSRCTTSVVDTWYRWYALTCECLHEFSKKFEMSILFFSGAWGKMTHEKT